jgi:hypothetical protein
MPHQDDDVTSTGGSPSTPPAKPREPLRLSPNEIEKGKPGKPGGEMDLVSLAPQYAQEQHGLYLDLLERAINHHDTRNVALTGTFGAGKSSVLKPLRDSEQARKAKKHSEFTGDGKWREHTVTTLSLSTLDPDAGPPPDAKNAAEKEPSNRIQKELVKQLLYQLPAGRASRSRFRRLVHPSPLRRVSAAALAFALALAIVGVIATLAGWVGDNTRWRIASALTIVAALTACFFTVWWLAGDRLNLQAGFNAGPATVRLDPKSTSYFDQYLDEIMYFFQVSKTDVVLIEDLDRFEDIAVFDTLRALNDLVNESGEIGRRVVFVYAVSDSILSEIGAKKVDADPDKEKNHVPADPVREKRALALGNQTKFFDVIIPIVPFVTTANARDLLMQVMEPEKTGITPALIRLAARHVSDMRLMWSIRNQFEVHADRLLDKSRIMPGNKPDIVFALVLLRATVPGAYEKIQITESPLDTLYTRWRDLVNENIHEKTDELTKLRTQLANGKARATRAENAAQRLEALRSELTVSVRGSSAEQVRFTGPVQDDDLANVDGWSQISNDNPLTIGFNWSVYSGSIEIRPHGLSQLLGMNVEPEVWKETDLSELKKEISQAEKDLHRLRHHSWKDLCLRSEFRIAQADDEPSPKPNEVDPAAKPENKNTLSFNELVEHYGPSTLAKELIRGGYLPFDFASYGAIYYGGVVNPVARDYIRRYVETGDHDINFSLTDEYVEQILREQDAGKDDADLFDDPVLYNIDIVDYLLRKRPNAAQRVATRLTRWGEDEREFVDAFFGRTRERDREYADIADLARLMAPTWTQAVRYAAVDAPVEPKTRIRLVNSVLHAIPDNPREDLDEEVAAFLGEHYVELPAYRKPASKTLAEHMIRIAAESGATLRNLSPLNKMSRAAAARLKIYPVTAANLTALVDQGVSLDVLRSEETTLPIYEHVLDNFSDYLDALCALTSPASPVKDPEAFASILTAVAEQPPELIDRLVELTPPECQVKALADTRTGVPDDVWPILIARGRTGSTFENVRAYVDAYDVDEELGAFLVERREIATPEGAGDEERVDLAVAVLSAREWIPDPGIRVGLACTLEPECIPIERIEDEDGNLIGLLLAAGLLPDEAATFDHRRLTHWEDFKAAVAASDQFGEFANASIISTEFLAKALDPVSGIDPAIKTSLAEKVAEIMSPPSNEVEPCEPIRAQDATTIARTLHSKDYSRAVSRSTIEALCTGGADQGDVVQLVADHDELSADDVKAILRSLGGDYARVADRGYGRLIFPNDTAHKSVLKRLTNDTHTGVKPLPGKGGVRRLRVDLKHPR